MIAVYLGAVLLSVLHVVVCLFVCFVVSGYYWHNVVDFAKSEFYKVHLKESLSPRL